MLSIGMKCCETLKRVLLQHFAKNLKKFEVYSEENIFQAPYPHALSRQPKATEPSIDYLREELERERERFHELSEQKAQLSALLREMQGALFDLRVSGQTLESLNLQPLADTLAGIYQQVKQLKSMIITANGVIYLLKLL
jgi:hypothetical protein